LLRVAVFTPDFPPAHGGIQQLVHRLVRHASRIEPLVVTIDQHGAAEFDAAQQFAVRRSRHAGWRAGSVGLLNLRAFREAAVFRPDVVLNAHIVTSPAAALARLALRVPVVQYLHAAEVGARPRLAAFAVRTANVSIVVSRHTETLATAVGGKEERLRRIPPGVDLPADADDGSAPHPTIVTVARLESRYKGFDVMVRALPLVRARVPDVQWVIVGDGPLRGRIERIAASHRLDGVARFVGEVSDSERDRLLRQAHVFAMPSRLPARRMGGEGFGIVYLEAGAHGLPVVAGNVGGALDAVVDQGTGLLVDPTDHIAVADALLTLLLDPVRAKALGHAGRKRAREFAWPRIAERVEDVLIDVAGVSS
jgi:phosphatidylinositol alpha-1,6-mannosyltransferase